jgi:hypothetical protein
MNSGTRFWEGIRAINGITLESRLIILGGIIIYIRVNNWATA